MVERTVTPGQTRVKQGISELADGIVVINLDDRRDRWEALQIQASRQFDPSELQRLSAIRGTGVEGYGRPPYFRGRKRDRTWAGRAGCALSHREAIALAANKGWRCVLILEDDIEFSPDFGARIKDLAAALQRTSWDICYLGFTDPIGPFQAIAPLGEGHQLQTLYGCNTAHAYLVRDTAYASLLQALPTRATVWPWLTRHRAIDRWYARTLSQHFTVLAVSPSIANQANSLSDITGRHYERAHVNTIPPQGRPLLPYGFARTLRKLQFKISGAYDAIRGLIKRRRGF